jgi:hypothetical protein
VAFSADNKASTFVRGASLRPARPWERHDKHAPPSKGFTLRLNEYQLELLRGIASAQTPRTSQQALALHLLTEALEKAAEQLK